jgi:uncharacterized membrane protein (UPF0127 family)
MQPRSARSNGPTGRLLVTPFLGLALVGCAAPPSVPDALAGWPVREIRLDGEVLTVVVAQDLGRGLSGVDGLGDLDGMLFEYPAEVAPGAHPFWMAGVRFPLDILFFDGAGRLVDRTRMAPCDPPVDCPRHAAPGPFRWVLETAAGRLDATRDAVLRP